jgi:thiosulfate/3-mercaptopyruvate sulfurtransferase
MRDNIITVNEAKAVNPRFVDVRWYMPNDARTSLSEFSKAHIEGAVRLDLDDLASPSDTHPHLMPDSEQIAEFLSNAGITEHDLIIVYDDTGFFTAPRGWWLFKSLGHSNVKVLQGGLNAWVDAGGAVSNTPKSFASVDYIYNQTLFQASVSRYDVHAAINQNHKQIVDARPNPRFTGEAPEPRPELSSGHMPSALNVPFQSLVDEKGEFHASHDLFQLFIDAGLTPDKPVIASCGSGITACVVLLGLYEAGWKHEVALYDGSWIDWASQPDALIVKG